MKMNYFRSMVVILNFALLAQGNQRVSGAYKAMCYDGSYASDIKYCPNKANGCPFYATHRCSNGQCVASVFDCTKSKCSSDQFVCNDGSCHDNEYECADINYFGCPGNLIRCVNGQCLENCYGQENSCNKSGETWCPTGQCVTFSSVSNCIDTPSELTDYCNKLSLFYLGGSHSLLKPCIDGTCVHLSSDCPALNLDSINSLVPCGNKIYRKKVEDCPNSCPGSLTRCSNGACIKGHCYFQYTPEINSTARPSDCDSNYTLCLGTCTKSNCTASNSSPMYLCQNGAYAHFAFPPLADNKAIVWI